MTDEQKSREAVTFLVQLKNIRIQTLSYQRIDVHYQHNNHDNDRRQRADNGKERDNADNLRQQAEQL